MFCRTGAGTLLLWGHPPDSFPGVITASGIVTSLPFQSECGLSSENPPPCLGWAQDRQSTTGPREALFPEEPGRRVQPGSQASLPSPPDPSRPIPPASFLSKGSDEQASRGGRVTLRSLLGPALETQKNKGCDSATQQRQALSGQLLGLCLREARSLWPQLFSRPSPDRQHSSLVFSVMSPHSFLVLPILCIENVFHIKSH